MWCSCDECGNAVLAWAKNRQANWIDGGAGGEWAVRKGLGREDCAELQDLSSWLDPGRREQVVSWAFLVVGSRWFVEIRCA